jgi:hypothetical protein
MDRHTVAGGSALLAIPALLLSGLFAALFFGGAGFLFGPLNDFFVALTLFLLAPPALALRTAVGNRAGTWFTVLTWLAIAGMLLGGIGQLLLIVGVISLQTSFLTGGVGITPVLAWSVGIAVLALGMGALPRPLGWLTVAALALSAVLSVASSFDAAPLVWVLSLALIVVLATWLGNLGFVVMRLKRTAG